MDEVVMLLGEKPKELLEYVLERGIVLNLCYTEQGCWRTTTAAIIKFYPESFVVQITGRNRAHPVVLAADQLVGVSFQYTPAGGQDRFIFGTNVLSVKFGGDSVSGREITLALPEEIEIVRKKNYLRTSVPELMEVDVQLWHRSIPAPETGPTAAQVCHGYTARLVNLAADGLAVLVSTGQGPDFANGQYVGLRFTPLANETPLSFNACVSHVLPTWDGRDAAVELEMVGLEASPEGRMVLRRLCNVVGLYRTMLQTEPASQTAALRHAATT